MPSGETETNPYLLGETDPAPPGSGEAESIPQPSGKTEPALKASGETEFIPWPLGETEPIPIASGEMEINLEPSGEAELSHKGVGRGGTKLMSLEQRMKRRPYASRSFFTFGGYWFHLLGYPGIRSPTKIISYYEVKQQL